jgi:hypothetical protein
MRSGVKVHRSELIEDGQVKGLLVAKDWWECYHPQLLPPPMRPDGLPRRRPAPDDSTATTPAVLTVSVTGTTATLTWTASSNNETMIRSYQVWRATGTDPAVLLDTLPVSQDIYLEDDVDGSFVQLFVYDQPYVDDTLAAATQYTYYIQTIPYYGGQAAVSNSVVFATLASTPVLSGVLDGTTINLSWVDTDDLDGFYLYRSTDGINYTLYQTLGADVFSYADSGLATGEYWYFVVGYSGVAESADSNVVDETVDSNQFVITVEEEAFQGFYGYSYGDTTTSAFGTLNSGSSPANTTISAFYDSSDSDSLNIFVIALVGVSEPPSQDVFTSITFKDSRGSQVVLNSAGTGTSGDGTMTFFHYSTGGLDDLAGIWEWEFTGGTYPAFTIGDEYTVTFT